LHGRAAGAAGILGEDANSPLRTLPAGLPTPARRREVSADLCAEQVIDRPAP
jgi:hypothetical protein